jgi:hypothetical protein
MRFLKKKELRFFPVKENVLRKLRRVSDSEVMMWVDNIHSGMGKNVQELRKSLGTHDQALTYVEDIRAGAVSLLAAMEIFEERRKS